MRGLAIAMPLGGYFGGSATSPKLSGILRTRQNKCLPGSVDMLHPGDHILTWSAFLRDDEITITEILL